MAKYTIKFSCGHEEEKQLFGPNKDRERKIKFFEERGVCSACYRAEKKAEGPKFLVRHIPGFNPAAAESEATRAREAAQQALAILKVEINKFSPEDRARFEQDPQRYSRISCDPKVHYAGSLWREARRMEEDASRADRAAARPAEQPRYEIGCYTNSFDVKDELKGRGWKFTEQCPRPSTGDLAKDMLSGWGKGWIFSSSDLEKISVELKWIAGHGYPLHCEGAMERAFKSVIEGRPELAR